MATTPTAKVHFDEAMYAPPEFAPFRFAEFPRSEAEWERVRVLMDTIDPITLDVVEGAFEAAIDEGEAAVERTSRSEVIREQHDYRAAITTVDCDAVTHVSWAPTPDPVRSYFPLDEVHEGDVFLYNDVHESHGTITHLPDYCVVIPVFADGRVVAWVTMMGHTKDVGGRVIGSWPITSTSIFEEGVQIPPVKLVSAGKVNRDIYNIVLRNTRFPDEERGDIDAFLGGARIVERRVQELCERLGADVVEAAMYKLIVRCGDTVRDVILTQIPDGEYVGEDFVDNDGITFDQPVKERVTVKKDADKMLLDWTGTSAQVPGAVNWPAGPRFVSKWLGAVLKQFAPGTVMNEGLTRAFRCHVPPGTVLTPEYPAAASNRMQVKLRTFGALTVALAQALDGQVAADMHCAQIYGFFGYDSDGELFLYREVFGAGSGARPHADGVDAANVIPHTRNLPAEFIEQRFPVRVERVDLYRDSAGVGKYRGGFGFVKELRVLTDCNFLTNVDRTAFACFGVAGGGAGAPGASWINPDTPEERLVQFSHEEIPVKAGDLIRLATPGGGGWGDPLERDVDAVVRDVRCGLVSAERARRDYGVVMEQVDRQGFREWVADQDATEQARSDVRAARPAMKMISRGSYADELKAEGRLTFEEPLVEGEA